MTSFYLTAVCCIPMSNPKARLRELEVFHEVAAQNFHQIKNGANSRLRGRWDGNEEQHPVQEVQEP